MATHTKSITDPKTHARRVREMLLDIVHYTRDEVHEVKEPHARALFETTAETLEGLAHAYEDYDEGTEEAFER
jgi:hypothetical protein